MFLFHSSVKSQSTMEFQPGTQIEVTIGADICADNVVMNGTYSGGGTQCEEALPVEIVSFTAEIKNNVVEMLWKTASEVNNYGFEIERSRIQNTEARSQNKKEPWIKAGFVEGNGTTTSPKEYSFADKNLSSGKYIYRLKQIDHDGQFEYSQSVEVEVGNAPKVFTLQQNYPNPFNPVTTIGFTLQVSGMTSLKIYDIIGREEETLVNEHLDAGVYYQKTFDASNLASGIYFARLQSGEKMQLKKLLLMK